MAPFNTSESLSTQTVPPQFVTGSISHTSDEGIVIRWDYVLILLVLVRYLRGMRPSLKTYLARRQNTTCKTNVSSSSSEDGLIVSHLLLFHDLFDLSWVDDLMPWCWFWSRHPCLTQTVRPLMLTLWEIHNHTSTSKLSLDLSYI